MCDCSAGWWRRRRRCLTWSWRWRGWRYGCWAIMATLIMINVGSNQWELRQSPSPHLNVVKLHYFTEIGSQSKWSASNVNASRKAETVQSLIKLFHTVNAVVTWICHFLPEYTYFCVKITKHNPSLIFIPNLIHSLRVGIYGCGWIFVAFVAALGIHDGSFWLNWNLKSPSDILYAQQLDSVDHSEPHSCTNYCILSWCYCWHEPVTQLQKMANAVCQCRSSIYIAHHCESF